MLCAAMWCAALRRVPAGDGSVRGPKQEERKRKVGGSDFGSSVDPACAERRLARHVGECSIGGRK